MHKTLFLFFLTCIASFAFAQKPTMPPPFYPTKLTVSQDGKGDYVTIQEAVNAVRDLSQVQVLIYIKKGVYKEKLAIPSWKTNISLIGEDKDSTIITNNDYSGKPYLVKDAYGKDKFSTYTSYTLLIQGNDCRVEHLTVQNTAGRVGQAVAIHIEADRCMVLDCKLLGNQDTLYAAKAATRQYYKDCYIEGTTDFIFGEAIAVFEHCIIKSLTNSYITAASTRQGQKFGFVFLHCNLIADTGVTKVYLGRPWRPYSQTVFINTSMGKHILPIGWENWKSPANETTAFYAEYNSKGEGANANERVKWSKKLSAKQADGYTLSAIFESQNDWKP